MFLGLFGELFVYSLYCLSLFKSIEMAITHVFFSSFPFTKSIFPTSSHPRLHQDLIQLIQPSTRIFCCCFLKINHREKTDRKMFHWKTSGCPWWYHRPAVRVRLLCDFHLVVRHKRCRPDFPPSRPAVAPFSSPCNPLNRLENIKGPLKTHRKIFQKINIYILKPVSKITDWMMVVSQRK